MIRSFSDRVTEAVFRGDQPKGFPQKIFARARQKLELLHAAESLDHLKVPPSNKLHALGGDRKGQHAIWINDQYRICFVWRDGGADEVEIVDYH